MADMMAEALRPVLLVTDGHASSDGDGVKLRRYIGTPDLDMIDPFLMLDWFHSDEPNDYIGGFPDHPHRGFETVTYMQAGKVRHWDNQGHSGVVEPGGVQWMTAASGVIHSEMPEQDNGLLSGFQLWINLPAINKMDEPGYQEFDNELIPIEARPEQGVTVKVIAGDTDAGTSAAVQDIATNPIYWDVHMHADSVFEDCIDVRNNAFIFVHEGAVEVISRGAEPVRVRTSQLGVLGAGNKLKIRALTDAKVLVAAAMPLNEPVARGGPFVMNTRAEILQAFEDYREGRF
ncbi:pirin family protein [Coralliovum pocilloporae]|uniref:pirin family protein n=1 Tax=Coralliovum pocilloporae TaxID=3066369 RepID=UPI003307241D